MNFFTKLASLFTKSKTAPVVAATSATLWDARVLSAFEFQTILGAFESMSDNTYAVVNEDALPAFNEWFRARLHDLGVVKWDPKQDCDNWARLFVDLMNLKFYLAQWERGSLPNAESLAVAAYWYRPGCNSVSHAIVAIATRNGLKFIEPQTGAYLTLTENEIASRLRIIA